MAWYNLLSRNKPAETIALHCDNPQCALPIEVDRVAYDKAEREIYHPDVCVTFADAHRIFNSGAMIVTGTTEYVSRNKALRLYRKGKLKQASETPGIS